MACYCCKGTWHPATGFLLGGKARICVGCHREFIQWLRRHTSRKWAGRYFYEDAAR